MTEDNWSVPESDVFSSIRDLLDADRDGILATIVDVEGSAYRRSGAKMLIPEDGNGVGSITAGCLEDELLRLASDVLEDGSPRLESFDLMGDDDVWGLGVGCNGVIDLLLEPVNQTFEPVLDAYEGGNSVASATVIDSEDDVISAWTRIHYHPDEGLTSSEGTLPEWFETSFSTVVESLVETGNSDTVIISGPDGDVTVFIDGITPPPTLVIVGTGHDVSPVVELGKQNDFRTVVVGFRGGTATQDRFPEADDVVSTSPADIRDAVDIDGDTYVVVMSHNFIDDRLALDEFIKSPAAYIGLMGPRKRFEEMLEAFEDEGRTFSKDELADVYTPIGLDLGGGTPYQIATSIVAEVLAVHNDRTPQHLKEREGPIHERVEMSPIQ